MYIELTGGAQAGLNFARADNGAQQNGAAQGQRAAARQRPTALASKVTEAEARAHAAFVDELGEDCLWLEGRS